MFARMARRPGTDAYDDYYSRHPEFREIDDRIRKLPDLCRPGGLYYDERVAGEAEAYFRDIDGITPDPRLVARWADRISEAADPTSVLRRMHLELGAVAAGCCTIDPAFIYTKKGRFDADYGAPVLLKHQHAVVFLVEMDHAAMQEAPRAETIRESARQYYRAARISLTAAAAIRAAGHDAKAHYDAHYDLILPAIAVAAGLGEMGRNNILIADRFGSRVRIGAVSTSLPLRPAKPVDLGATEFCRRCRKCAENCPSRALSMGDREEVRGVLKWPTNVERCYAYWRRAGTDCGICMAVCPFSHKDNALHNLMRRLIRLHPLIARPAVIGDDLVYGRKWRR